jgi:hypothetical protein
VCIRVDNSYSRLRCSICLKPLTHGSGTYIIVLRCGFMPHFYFLPWWPCCTRYAPS